MTDRDQPIYLVPNHGDRNHGRGRGRVYHTDPNCQHLPRDGSYRTAQLSMVDDGDLVECARCSGEAATHGPGSGAGHLQSLLEAARENREDES